MIVLNIMKSASVEHFSPGTEPLSVFRIRGNPNAAGEEPVPAGEDSVFRETRRSKNH